MIKSKNCNGLKYGTSKIFDIFELINFDGDQNTRKKKRMQ